MPLHIIALRRIRTDRWHPVCGCGAVFPYVDDYGAARAAADAHLAELVPLVLAEVEG